MTNDKLILYLWRIWGTEFKKKAHFNILIPQKSSQLDPLAFSPLIILGYFDFTILTDQKERVGLSWV